MRAGERRLRAALADGPLRRKQIDELLGSDVARGIGLYLPVVRVELNTARYAEGHPGEIERIRAAAQAAIAQRSEPPARVRRRSKPPAGDPPAGMGKASANADEQ